MLLETRWEIARSSKYQRLSPRGAVPGFAGRAEKLGTSPGSFSIISEKPNNMSDKLLELAQQNWHKPLGLFFSVGAAILFEIILLNSLNTTAIVAGTIHATTAIIVIVAWLYSNRYPKTPKGKVGFVVSIQCSNEKENKKIQEDFVDTLRKLLKNGSLGSTFHYIEIPQHIAKKINDNDDALNLKAKTKALFVIYGRVRLRQINGKDCHILELEGLVAHKQLPQEISTKLANEFGELFPRRVHIPTENDLLSFNFTTDWSSGGRSYLFFYWGKTKAISHRKDSPTPRLST